MSKLSKFVKKNKKAVLGTLIAPGLGTMIGAGLDKVKSMKKKQEAALQAMRDEQARADQDLTNWNNNIGGGGGNGYDFDGAYKYHFDNDINGFRSMPEEAQLAFLNRQQAGYNAQPVRNDVMRAQPVKKPAYSLQQPGSMPFDTLPPAVQDSIAATNPEMQQRLAQLRGAQNPQPQVMPELQAADATPSAPKTITNPAGGIAAGPTQAGQDEGKLLAEAELAKTLRQQSFDTRSASRKKYLEELGATLQKQQSAALNDQMPGIYEDLNTRGLLRSSALGEKVGLEATKLARQTSEQLALQGITDRGGELNELSAMEEAYLGSREGAMGRRFSLEDFSRQVTAGQKLGYASQPVAPSQKGAKGSAALQGGLGGAATGATVGGPMGAAIGGGAGLLAGGSLGGK